MSSRASTYARGYYAAHGGKSLLWASEDTLGLFVLIQLLGIDALAAGTLFMMSAFLNAGMDMVSGMVLGRSRRDAAKLARLVGAAVIFAAAGLALLPWLPADAVLLAGTVLIVARLSHSVLDVAHNALSTAVARIEGDLRLAQRRAFLSSVASFMVGVLVIPLRARSDTDVLPALTITCLALLALPCLFPLPKLVRALSVRTPDVRSPTRGMSGGIVRLCLAALVGMAGLGALAKSLLHLQFPAPWLGPVAVFLYMLARLAAVGVWQPVATRLGNRVALQGALTLAAFGGLALPFLAGTIAGSMAAILLLGLAGGGCAMLCWALLTELVQAGEDESGMGDAGIYGAFTMTAKIGLGVSGFAIGIWLDAVPLTNGSLTRSSNIGGLAVASALCCLAGALVLGIPRGRLAPVNA